MKNNFVNLLLETFFFLREKRGLDHLFGS